MESSENTLFRKILLVDDDDASVFLSKIILTEMQAASDIEVAWDGLSARGVIGETNWPDLIFLDLNMPRMNGFDFLELLGKTGVSNHTRIVVLSSSGRKEDRDKALGYKAVIAFVEKPLTEDSVRKIAVGYSSPPEPAGYSILF